LKCVINKYIDTDNKILLHNELELFFEHSQDVMCFFNDKGEIIKYNESFIKLTGVSRGIFWDSIHPEDVELCKSKTSQMQYGQGSCELELRVKNIDNSFVLIEFNVVMTSSNIYYAIGHHITSCQKSKMLVREDHQELTKYRLALDSAFDHIVITDPNGIVIYANPGVEALTGYSNGETVGSKAGKLWGGLMSKKLYKELWDKIKIDKVPFVGTITNKRKNGELYEAEVKITSILNSEGEIIFFVGIERDITKEKNTEIEKIKNEAILENIGEGLVVTDIDGKIIVVNNAFVQLTGWNLFEVVGKNMFDVLVKYDDKGTEISRDKRSLYRVLVGEVTEGRVSTISDTHWYKRKDGTKLPVTGVVTPIVVDGIISGAVQLFRDITKEKEVDKMKTDFISLVSHQLRTPLTSIRWFIELLRNDLENNCSADQKEYILKIDQSNNAMIDLVNSLLNVSRIESGKLVIVPDNVDGVSLLKEVIGEVEVQYKEKNQKLSVEIANDFPTLYIDKGLLRQIFINLLTNAIKYSDYEKEIRVILQYAENEIVFEVIDQGCGIPDNQFDKIFHKFFRAENALKIDTNGSGLGLYMVKSIVNVFNGSITYSSKIDRGTVFTVRIPRNFAPDKV